MKKVYGDSDCILGWLKAEPEKKVKCEGTLQTAEAGEIIVCVSALTIAEVIRLSKKPKLKREQEEIIRVFFENDFIDVYNIDSFVATYARQLMWEHDRLKPKDSIHVATACFHQITILNTFDKDLLRLDKLFPLRGTKETLRIREPEISTNFVP